MMTSFAERTQAARDWVDRLFPAAAKPYARLMRIDRPIGIWLLMFPCWWGVALASPSWPDPWLLALFAIGAATMRAAGCAFNDVVDRGVDRRVARTASRPVASGLVSVPRALALAAFLSLVGLIVLLQFNGFTIALAIASLALVIVYPFAKRFTDWPQMVLGLAFNWGALVGWVAVKGELSWSAFLLYLGGVAWTLGYDTIYAHQDARDDRTAGVRSTALLFGARSKRWIGAFYGAFLTCVFAAAVMEEVAVVLVAPLLGPVAAQLAWQVGTLKASDPQNCLRRFRSNQWAAAGVFAALVIGRVAG